MNYYDFEEHFWSAEEVCAQAKESNQDKKTCFCSRIIASILNAFFPKKLEQKPPQNSIPLLSDEIETFKSSKP